MSNVIVCGEKKICERIIDFIKAQPNVNIVCVFCGENDWEADIPYYCKKNHLKFLKGNINDYDKWLKNQDIDVIFSIQERRLIKKHIIDLPKVGIYNLHFGDITKGYRGCDVIAHAILNGEKTAGVTLHYINERFDEGDIIDIKKINIGDSSARNVYDRLSNAAYNLFVENFSDMLTGKTANNEQNLETCAMGYYKKGLIDYEVDSIIDSKQPLEEMLRKLQAFTFQPFQYPSIIDGSINILEIIDYKPIRNNDGKLININITVKLGENNES